MTRQEQTRILLTRLQGLVSQIQTQTHCTKSHWEDGVYIESVGDREQLYMVSKRIMERSERVLPIGEREAQFSLLFILDFFFFYIK